MPSLLPTLSGSTILIDTNGKGLETTVTILKPLPESERIGEHIVFVAFVLASLSAVRFFSAYSRRKDLTVARGKQDGKGENKTARGENKTARGENETARVRCYGNTWERTNSGLNRVLQNQNNEFFHLFS